MSDSGSSRRASLIVLLGLAALCVGMLVLNHGMPLVRNGFVYARAAENVIAHGYDARAVVADSTLSYDKPIGFAWLASPFVALFGNHLGLYVPSLLGTLAYLAATWWFLRAFDPFGLSERERAWGIVFAGLSPIVAYQVWSGHPDTLFAALYLVTFTLTHRIVERPTLGRIVVWSAAIFAAVLVKNYGMILLPSAGLYLVLNVRRLWRAEGGRRAIVALGVAFLVLGAIVGLGWAGHNPLMRFEGEGGGVGQYGKGDRWVSCRGTLVQVGIALGLNVQLALVPVLRRSNVTRAALVALVCFPIPYVVGLMLFPTTFYNMRYFIPLFPFAALLGVHGMRTWRPALRRAISAGFVVVGILLTLVFDVEAIYARCESWIPRWQVDWIGVPLSLLDNLRMPQHRAEKAWIENLNARVEPGGVVYVVDAQYYRDARHGVYERGGLIRADVQTRYVRSRELKPAEALCWVQGPLRDPSMLARFGKALDLGLGLYRVEREAHPVPDER